MFPKVSEYVEQAVIWLTLGILLLYSSVHFAVIPYAGFIFSQGRVVAIFVSDPAEPSLQVGDELLQVGPVSWADFTADLRQTLFEDTMVGEVVPLQVRRDDQVLSIPWLFPGFTSRLFWQRLLSGWWLPYLFWGLAVVTYLSVRPKGTRWRLLVAFNLLTAVWLAAGSGPSAWHVWHSALVLRATLWLCLPVYWHLHWVFPEPLGRLPAGVVVTGYLAGGVLALLQWGQWLPANGYVLAFLLAVGGSLTLLAAHGLLRTEQRRELRLLLQIGVLVVIPLLGAVIAGSLGSDLRLAALALLGLPLIPGAYIYVIYRRQAGRMQWRANRLIVVYAYLLLVATATAVVVAPLEELLTPSEFLWGIVPAVTVAAGITIAAYRPFVRLAERYILNVPLPPANLLAQYAVRLASQPDRKELAHILRQVLLPSLMVRQAALLAVDDQEQITPLLLMGVSAANLPVASGVRAFLAVAGPEAAGGVAQRPLSDQNLCDRPACDWIRLALPLKLGEKGVGLWLLGRRDPDDLYSPVDLPLFQALAAQTAVSLTNIAQAEKLYALYRANVAREEQARTRLARDLHDEVLNHIGTLNFFAKDPPPQFVQALASMSDRLRETIYDLRPALLDYGLGPALQSLVNSLQCRVGQKTAVCCQITEVDQRYPVVVEQHLYRIVQQALDNAHQHAQATMIRVDGCLAPDQLCLEIVDDGVGFSPAEGLDVSSLVARRHFGLVGMMERARLVGAVMTVETELGQGVRILIRWLAEENIDQIPILG
jgi:signal transduction histidine kinase